MEHLFWFALPLLLAQAVLGAVPVKIMPSHSHDIWDAAAGFPGGYVYSMTQTGDGYLWIGTSDQLWATDDHAHLFRYTAGRLEGPLPDIGKHYYGTPVVNRTRDGWLLFATEAQGMVEYEHGAAHVLLDPSTIPNFAHDSDANGGRHILDRHSRYGSIPGDSGHPGS
jgi:ligand-binding sensor domain-containing protein